MTLPSTLLAAGTAALLALAACTSTTSNTGTEAAPAADTSIRVVEHADTDAVIETGAKGDTSGDLLTFHNDVYDAADTTKIGTDQGECVRMDPKAGTWECWWTTFLQDGQITVEGPFSDTDATVLAITGGTGAYADATGEMDLEFHNDQGTEFDFVFHINGVRSMNGEASPPA